MRHIQQNGNHYSYQHHEYYYQLYRIFLHIDGKISLMIAKSKIYSSNNILLGQGEAHFAGLAIASDSY